MGINCDFSGWATRNDLLCGDGRTIRKDAFALSIIHSVRLKHQLRSTKTKAPSYRQGLFFLLMFSCE